MKISVAMAVCCGELFIREQLLSLFTQTMPPDEIVICDDSPDDRTAGEIKSFEEKYPGVIRYFKNPAPLGVSGNFSKAVSLTTGDIILLADQDDFWLPGKIAKLCSAIDAEHQGSFCDSILTDEKLKPLGKTHRQTRNFTRQEIRNILSDSAEDFENAALKRFPAAGHNMAFSGAMREKLLPFPELPECHDSWIGFSIMLHSRWAVVDESLTFFRQHSSNTSRAGRCSMLAQAKLSAKRNAAKWYSMLFEELIRRAGQEVPEKYRARQRYSAIRAEFPDRPFFSRFPLIFQLFFSGSYNRFGRGVLTAVQDFFFIRKQ